MAKLQQYTFVCAPSPLQHAALAALDVPMDDAVAAYRRKRDLAFERLSRKFEVVEAGGRVLHLPQAPRRAHRHRFRRPGDREQRADHPRQRLLRPRHPLPHQLRHDRRKARPGLRHPLLAGLTRPPDPPARPRVTHFTHEPRYPRFAAGLSP